MPKLILMFKDKILEGYPLTPGEEVTIGRHGNNTIVIDNLAVSGYHAAVTLNASGVNVSDLDSKNGTFVNDQRISESALSHKDTIAIGKHDLLVDLNDEIEAPEAETREQSPDAGLMTGNLDNNQTMVVDSPQDRFTRKAETQQNEPVRPEMDTLSVVSGGEGVFNLGQQKSISIGRNTDADIVVNGLWGLLMGSPTATINKQAGDYFLRYAGGLIKPKRNGAGIKGTIKLNHEDVVSIGPIQVQIQLK